MVAASQQVELLKDLCERWDQAHLQQLGYINPAPDVVLFANSHFAIAN
jgi:hypothetical protein